MKTENKENNVEDKDRMLVKVENQGYSRYSIVIHWITAILIISLFLTHEGEPGSRMFSFHVGGGAVVGLFLLWRVWRRFQKGMPAKPDQLWILNILSQIVIWGFLVTIVVVVISGYLIPWSLDRPLDIFGLMSIPSPIASNPGFHTFVEEMHNVAGTLFVPLLALHILGAAKHLFIDKDGIAHRMFKSISNGR